MGGRAPDGRFATMTPGALRLQGADDVFGDAGDATQFVQDRVLADAVSKDDDNWGERLANYRAPSQAG
jgi:hypothetical protein